MPQDHRKGPPGGSGPSSQSVTADQCDSSGHSLDIPIWPSADHPEYFFLNVCIPVDDGFWVEGQTRPVRGDFVEEVFGKTFRYFMPASAKWEPVPVTPIKYNLYFWPHDPLSSPRTAP